MENRNVNSTLQPLFEGSGNHVNNSTIVVVTTVVNETTDIQELKSHTTAATMKRSIIGLEDGNDNTTLLQTNILLIAVLVVCFITFASVIAMCVCFLRRYCKNRRISQTTQELYQTTLVSKATSITGLHHAHEYFSTKIEKCDKKQNKGTDCELELGAGRDVESNPNIASPQFDPISPVCYVPPEEAAPVYFRIKNAVTSTPTSTEQLHNHVNGVDGKIDSPTEKQHIIFSVASPPSIYTSALSNHNQHTPSTIHAEVINAGTVNSGVPVRCLTKGPLTQSVSWFVPLKGIQREPLRHSVVDIFEDEISVDQQSADYQPRPSKKSRKSTDAPIDEESDIILCNIENEALCNASTATAESVPLMNNVTKNPPFESDDMKCSKERRLMSENGQKESEKVKDGLKRERSLSSPDEKTMWKQREDRPVLFLEPDSK